jgi:hypothetical protein
MPRKPLALAAVLALALIAPTAHAAIVPGQVIDGPSNLIQRFSDIDMAPDGTGALAYVKKVGIEEHIFVSRFVGGAWTPPEQISTGLTCNCANAHVAAGNGGRVVVVFTDAGLVAHAAIKANAAAPFQLTLPDAGTGAAIQDLDVDMDPVSGVAYAIEDTGAHIAAARYPGTGTTWSTITTGDPNHFLDKVPGNANAAGTGQQNGGRIAVDSTGNAVAIWPEGAPGDQHVYVRRISGTTASSTIPEASIATLSGHNSDGLNTDTVDISGAGSPNPWVTFREQFTYGGAGKPRDLARQLVGDSLSGAQVLDGLPLDTPTEGAEFPRIEVNPAGQGLAALPTQLSSQIIGSRLGGGLWTTGFQVDPGVAGKAPFPEAAIADSGNGLITWVDSSMPTARIQARTVVGGALGAPLTLSLASGGGILSGGPPVEASSSSNGIVAIGFGQQGATTSTIVAAIVDLPSGSGPPPPPPKDTAPTISGLKLSRKTFAIGSLLPKLSRKTKVGTTISFKVDQQSITTFAFSAKKKGFKVGKRCKARAPKGRRAKRCTRFVRVGGFRVNTPAGSHKERFQGRISRRRTLKPGRYRLTLTATDPAGNQSKSRSASFRLKRK